MSQAQADDGLRIARAHAALWTAILARDTIATADPVRSLGASWAEMRDDSRRNAEAAAKDASAHPGDSTRAERAAQAATLAANLAPFSDTLPRPYIVVIYEGDRDARETPRHRKAS
ncbi:MAG: hypothetical protein FJ335_13760 [Sphingomonadales bacterium]|nr:hypothetical protein [Sphingomonadales bacterium]